MEEETKEATLTPTGDQDALSPSLKRRRSRQRRDSESKERTPTSKRKRVTRTNTQKCSSPVRPTFDGTIGYGPSDMFNQAFAPSGPRTNTQKQPLSRVLEPIHPITTEKDLLGSVSLAVHTNRNKAAILDVTCRYGIQALPE